MHSLSVCKIESKTLKNMAIINKYSWLWSKILILKGLINYMTCKDNNTNNDEKIDNGKVGQSPLKGTMCPCQMRCLLSWWSEFGPPILNAYVGLS